MCSFIDTYFKMIETCKAAYTANMIDGMIYECKSLLVPCHAQ